MSLIKKNKTRGFTLIELLVVVAIVSLLSSIIFASLNSARSKARDSKRLSDIHNLQLALEFYFDANGFYPPSGGAVNPNVGWSNSAEPASWGAGSTFQTAMAPYMPNLPVDPQNPVGWITNDYYYALLVNYGCNSKGYIIIYKLENGASKVSPGFTACDNTIFQYNGGALNSSSASGIITIGAKQ